MRSDEERVDLPSTGLHEHGSDVCAREIERRGSLRIARGQRRISRHSERCHENDILLDPMLIDESERFVDGVVSVSVVAGTDERLRPSNPLEGLLTVSG